MEVIDHRMRGSASPALLANVLVRLEMVNFGPPAECHPLSDHQKNFFVWLCWWRPQLCHIWCKYVNDVSVGMGEIQQKLFLFIYSFLETLKVWSLHQFWHVMAESSRGMSFMGYKKG